MKGQYFFIGSIIISLLLFGFLYAHETSTIRGLQHLLYVYDDYKMRNIINELNYASELEIRFNKSYISNFSMFLRAHENICIFYVVQDKTHNKTIIGNYFKNKLNVSMNTLSFVLMDKNETTLQYMKTVNVTYCYYTTCINKILSNVNGVYFHIILREPEMKYEKMWNYRVVA